MKVTITLKCDRSGRTEDVQIDSGEIEQYEQMQQKREATLQKIQEFLASIPPEDMPDLIAVYRGDFRHFINVSKEYCDKPVARLLDQLFHASDPKARAKKAKSSKNKNKDAKGNGAKTAKDGVKDKASAKSSPDANPPAATK
jgi:hypothetical protein